MFPTRFSMAVAIIAFYSFTPVLFSQIGINCPASIKVKTSEAGIGHCSVSASWLNPEAINCDRSALLELSIDENAPQVVRQGAKFTASALEVGEHTLRYTIGKAGSTYACATTLTVVDDEAPKIKNCPTTLDLVLNRGMYEMPNLLSSVTVTDNCSGIETVQYPEAGLQSAAEGEIIQGFVIAAGYFNSASTTCQFSIRISSPVLAYEAMALNDDCEEECPEESLAPIGVSASKDAPK
jgi:hypothetical protein